MMLDDIREDVTELSESVQCTLAKAIRALLFGDETAGEDVLAGDDLIDRMDLDIAQRCGDLLMLGDDLRPEERRELVAVLRMATDLERVADLAEEIALICREVCPPYPGGIGQRLAKLTELTSRMLATALQAFAERDLQALTRLRESEDTVDVAQRWLHAEVLRHLRAMPGDMKVGVGLLFISHSLGRVADHATNIGESAIYAVTGQLGRLRNYRPTDYPASLLPLV